MPTRLKRKKPHKSPSLSQLSSESDNSPPPRKVKWDGHLEAVNAEKSTQPTLSDSQEDCNSASGKICLASVCYSFQIGCAYYDPRQAIIYLLEDTKETKHFDLTQMVLEQANPNVILTSSKSDSDFLNKLKAYADSNDEMFVVRPQKDFTAAKGRARLVSLRMLVDLPSEHISSDGASEVSGGQASSNVSNAYDFMKRRRAQNVDPTLVRWNASIRMENFASLNSSPLCLAAIGALLDHLLRANSVGELEDLGIEGLEVNGIQIMALESSMHINADALLSLQVFDPESHASAQSTQTKEGLSLFGILNNTRTYLGRSLLHQWMLRPSTSLEVIEARHNTVACFLRAENLSVSDAMHGHLKGIGNMGRTLYMLKTGRGGMKEWQALVKFTFHCVMLREALTELSHSSGVVILKKLTVLLGESSFKDLGITINETIDWEESNNASRVCVKPHIDPQLDEWKHIYHGLDSVLSKVAQQVSRDVPPDYVDSLNVVYFPQLGFLISIPLREDWKGEEGIQLLDEWTFQFASESQVYVKSSEMHDMDRHIGDLLPHIVDREIEIIQTLLEKIVVYEDSIVLACELSAELDCLLSFAEAAKHYNYIRPEMVKDTLIDIRQGRHPLQEQVVDSFVPNDTCIGSKLAFDADYSIREEQSSVSTRREGRVVILTGANACGKSVYLKQVALIQLMAQIGCFVPAERALLGIVDKIFTRIQTRESVSKVQSAFMIDLNQVSLALRNSTPRSLLLLDEFGKGTISTDGAALFAGVLKCLTNRGFECPIVLAATHFHDLFDQQIFTPSPSVIFLHMEVILTSSSGNVIQTETRGSDDSSTGRVMVDPGESITYLYRIAEGICLDSHAAKCALMFGVPPRVVQRAKYVSDLIRSHETGRLLDELMTDAEQEELREAEECCRKFLAWKLAVDEEDDGSIDIRGHLAQVLGRQIVSGAHEITKP